jgi:hypothetical protein
MANIRNNALFEQKSGEFRTRGGSMDRFREDYVNCVNDVIALINLEADLETAIAMISDTEGTIGLSDLYRYPFTQLVSMRLFEQGQRPTKGGEDFYRALQVGRGDYVDECRQGIVNAASDADDDDDTTDIVGLGALG